MDKTTFAHCQIQAGLSNLGLYSGDIDGIAGPNMKAAITSYAESIGLKFGNTVHNNSGTIQIITDSKKIKLPRDTPDEMTKFYGKSGDVETDWFDFPTDEIYLYERPENGGTPLPDRNKDGFDEHRTHKKLCPLFKAALKDIYTKYPDRWKKEGWHVYAGSYMVRPTKGGSTPSTHSWAAAVDFNPGQNPFGSKYINDPKARTFSDETIEIMESYGLLSGGKAWGHDYMHFQAAIPKFIRTSAPYGKNGLPKHITYAY